MQVEPVMTELAAVPTHRGSLERDLEDHRAKLTGYCYRMLGSPFEAEDAVQETLVRAWRALDRFEGRAALQSWLFGIATNVCFDMLKARGQRALTMDLGPSSPGDALPGATLPELLWVGPVRDERVLPSHGDPAEVLVARESIRLAFVAALQHLNPRQRAALILRDMLRWKAKEVALLLDTTTTSVESLLRRARAVLGEVDRARPAAVEGERARALVDRYADAFERHDVDTLVALLHEDVTLSMPPHPLWLQGVDAVRTWFDTLSGGCRHGRYLPVSANGSPGLAFYRPARPDGPYEAYGIQVMELSGARIIGIHVFLDPGVRSNGVSRPDGSTRWGLCLGT
jgi:RNA polymerase sigma-70 factor, ECF subfamily